MRLEERDERDAVLFRTGNEVLGHLNSDENFLQDDKQAETAEALATKGNEGLKFGDPLACCVCLKKFKKREVLIRHLETIHVRSKEFVCDFCPKFYFIKKDLVNHMKKHGQKSFKCKVCDYKTAFKVPFEQHQLTHGEKVECPICSKKVTSLKQHMNYTHKPKVSCPICLKMFHRSRLGNHIKTHEFQRIYVCEKCNECFESNSDLKEYAEKFAPG